MNKTLLFFLFILSSNLFSQDVITLNSGKQIEVVIVEINDSTIIYHKFDNQDGPIYKTDIQNVLEINYSNGKKVVYSKGEADYQFDYQQQDLTYHGYGLKYKGKKLKNREIRELYANYPKARQNYIASKVIMGVGFTAAIFAFGYSIYGRVNVIQRSGYPPGYILTVLTSAGVGITCLLLSPKKLKKSVGIYNKATENSNKSSSIDFKIGITNNGLGVLCSF